MTSSGKYQIKVIFVILVVLICSPVVQAGDEWSPWWWPPTGGVVIDPPDPNSMDVVSITLSGDWPSSCIPVDSNATVEGNNIYMDVIGDSFQWGGLAVITPWSQTQRVGPLSTGTYTVSARLVGTPYSVEEYVEVAEFTVTNQQFDLHPSFVVVPEGDSASFSVALLEDPLGILEVTVACLSGDPDIFINSGATLFFNSSNYAVPQNVTLGALDDEDYLNGDAIIQVSGPGYVSAQLTAKESDNYDVRPVLYVDTNTSGKNHGRHWIDAFTDLQDALALASYYPTRVKEIRVAQGVYTPAPADGKSSTTFRLIDGVNIKGGYAGLGYPDPNAWDVHQYETILSGDLKNNDGPDFVHIDDNSYHVVSGSGLLDGFTITAGRGFDGRGSGLYNTGDSIVEHCTFSRNSGAYGAGIGCHHGTSLVVIDCVFTQNRASWYGGGIYSWTAKRLEVYDCIFQNNTAGEGAGIFSFKTNCTINNCLFIDNAAQGGDRKEGYGAGIYHEIAFPGGQVSSITNCTFSGNSTVAENGAGIYHASYPYESLLVANCILYHNVADGGMDEAAQIFADNKPPVVNYSCIQGSASSVGGTGNIDADPLFADPGRADYRLKSQAGCWDPNSLTWVIDDVTSPCIDAGDPNSLIGWETHPHGGIINMGAYGGTLEASRSIRPLPSWQERYDELLASREPSSASFLLPPRIVRGYLYSVSLGSNGHFVVAGANDLSADQIALKFMDQWKDLFMVDSGAMEFIVTRTTPRPYGAIVRMGQTHAGFEVFGASAIVQIDFSGGVANVTCDMMVDPDPLEQYLNLLHPSLDAEQAGDVAVEITTQTYPGRDHRLGSEAELKIFDGGVLGLPGDPRLVWYMLITPAGLCGEWVAVDAHSGELVYRERACASR